MAGGNAANPSGRANTGRATAHVPNRRCERTRRADAEARYGLAFEVLCRGFPVTNYGGFPL